MDEIGESNRGFVKVTKKRRGKKNKNVFYPLKINSDGSVDESLADRASGSNLTEASDNEDNESVVSDYGVRVVDCNEMVQNNGRITTDAMMTAPPEIAASDEKLNELNVKEESDNQKETSLPNIVYNTKALSKFAATYELEKFEKNALIIFNQENLEGYSKPRLGTEKDVEALTQTFKKFGFIVQEYKDLTKDDLFKELKAFSEQDFTDYGCIAIAVLTHGTKNGLLRAKDQLYSEVEILNCFKSHDKLTLVTKPRLMIIQACRGYKGVQGVAVFQAGKIRKDLDDEVEPYYLPVESDMLVLHSSYAGNPSHRDEMHGSWFIQSLCSKVNELAPAVDFESIITEVKREVAIDRYHEEYNRKTFELDTNKQMPVVTSTFIRKLYLKEYGDVTPNTQATGNTTRVSSNEVLDNVPNTPLQLQFGPCCCFLEHFDYMRNCLRNFHKDNPDDITAKTFLDIAEAFEDTVEFNAVKEVTLRQICSHLMAHSKDAQFFKYLYLYKH